MFTDGRDGPTILRSRIGGSRSETRINHDIAELGLVAAAIQYGHLRVQMTLGYAGSYASGFPDDLAFEDWLARLDTLADAHERLREGAQVSGPAAETYRHRVQAATRFAGRVLRTKRHANANANANAMLANPTCRSSPARA